MINVEGGIICVTVLAHTFAIGMKENVLIVEKGRHEKERGRVTEIALKRKRGIEVASD